VGLRDGDLLLRACSSEEELPAHVAACIGDEIARWMPWAAATRCESVMFTLLPNDLLGEGEWAVPAT